MSAQWKGAETVSITARLAPFSCAIAMARSTAALWPETTTCAPPLSFAASQTSPLRRLAGDLQGGVEFEPEERRHGALPDRNGALHGIAADAQEPGRIGNRQAAGGGKRRIFAERVAGDEGRVALQVEPGFGLEHPERRQADRHQGRLGVGRQGQFLGRAIPDDGARASATEPSSTSSNTALACGKASARALPMPTAWLPWPGKYECALHTAALFN